MGIRPGELEGRGGRSVLCVLSHFWFGILIWIIVLLKKTLNDKLFLMKQSVKFKTFMVFYQIYDIMYSSNVSQEET